MEMRQIRGMEIARQNGIKKTENGWLVPSQTKEGSYHVTEEFSCNCPDYEFHKATCKHCFAVRYYLQVEKQTPQGVKTERVRISYKQAWRAYNSAQTNEIRLFDELLSDLVQGIEEPAYSFGRPRLSKRDVVFCAVQKAFSQLSSRRAVSLFGNAVEKQQIASKPHFTSVNNYLRDESLIPILYELITITSLPLKSIESQFSVDSTGFRTTCFGEWNEDKFVLGRQKKWLKAHACTGVSTHVITAVRVLEENSADSPQLPYLVQKTANGFEVKEVLADMGYSSAENYNAVQELGATAFIPFKSNASGSMRGSKYRLWRKAFAYFQLNSEEFYEHYRMRPNVESVFSAVKKKFGDTLKAKTPVSQKNELLCKLIAYNITVLIQSMFELGITPDFKREEKVDNMNKK